MTRVPTEVDVVTARIRMGELLLPAAEALALADELRASAAVLDVAHLDCAHLQSAHDGARPPSAFAAAEANSPRQWRLSYAARQQIQREQDSGKLGSRADGRSR